MSSTKQITQQTAIAHKHVEEREPKVQIAYAPLLVLGGHHFYIRLSAAAAKHFGVTNAHLHGVLKGVPAKNEKVTHTNPQGHTTTTTVSRAGYLTLVKPKMHNKIKIPKFSNAHFSIHKRKHEYFSACVSTELTDLEIALGLKHLLHTNLPTYFVTKHGARHYLNSGTLVK